MIDPSTNTVYLTHKTYVSGTAGLVHGRARRRPPARSGPGFPVRLSGTADNDPGNVVPGRQPAAAARPAADGRRRLRRVWLATATTRPYQGWVFGVSTAGQITARWVDNTSGSDGAGIWQSGVGLTSDGPGLDPARAPATAARPATPAAGTSPPAIVRRVGRAPARPSDGTLTPVDFFAPFDAAQLDIFDADFGSGGVRGAPRRVLRHLDGPASRGDRRQGGLRVPAEPRPPRRLRPGPRRGGRRRPAHRPARRRVGARRGSGRATAATSTSRRPAARTAAGCLDVYKYGLSGTGTPSLSLVASSPDVFGWGSGPPVITSDGTTSGSALVWIDLERQPFGRRRPAAGL